MDHKTNIAEELSMRNEMNLGDRNRRMSESLSGRISLRAICLLLIVGLGGHCVAQAHAAVVQDKPEQKELDSKQEQEGSKPDDQKDSAEDKSESSDPKKDDDQESEQKKDQDNKESSDDKSADDSAPEAEGDKDDSMGNDSTDDDSTDDEGGTHDERSTQTERRSRTARFLQFAKFNDQMKGLLKEQVNSAASGTIEVYVDDNEMPSALGMVVDASGFAMTKASMLTGAVRCKLPNGRTVPAIVYGIDTGTDLALLRLQATNLSAIQWSTQSEREAKEGFWVLSPGVDGELLSVGVLSVLGRQIPPVSGFIGIQMQPNEAGAEVTTVIRGSAAERYGLKTADVITAVDDKKVETPTDLSASLKNKRPGDVVALTVMRGETEMALRVVLGNREDDNPDNQRSVNQNTMSGEISERRDDFPMAFQHDSFLTPENCGGPIVDLDGRVLGMNISRSGRVKSYALPMSLVDSVFQRLATGNFSPEVVFADRLKGYESVMLELNTQAIGLTTEKAELDKEFSQQTANIEKVEGSIDSLEKQIEELKKQVDQKNADLEVEKTREAQVKSKVRSKEREMEKAKKHREELEKERRELLFGAN